MKFRLDLSGKEGVSAKSESPVQEYRKIIDVYRAWD